MRAEDYPLSSSVAVSAVMRGNRKINTKPEVLLRSELHRRGFRFRRNLLIKEGSIAVRPDVVFPKKRVAVFVDGCFWHRCPEHGVQPRFNAHYWTQKLDGNADRDRRVTAALFEEGWQVVRIWEHTNTSEAVEQVAEALAERTKPAGKGPLLRSEDAL